MLDLVNPLRSGRRSKGDGRQAGLYEARSGNNARLIFPTRHGRNIGWACDFWEVANARKALPRPWSRGVRVRHGRGFPRGHELSIESSQTELTSFLGP